MTPDSSNLLQPLPPSRCAALPDGPCANRDGCCWKRPSASRQEPEQVLPAVKVLPGKVKLKVQLRELLLGATPHREESIRSALSYQRFLERKEKVRCPDLWHGLH